MTRRRETAAEHVTVSIMARCVMCKATRTIEAGEVAPDDMPMCKVCYSPMVAEGAVAKARRERREGR